MASNSSQTGHPQPELLKLLPGPDRKRAETAYTYRLTYRNSDPAATGCRMIWEVSGGRMTYQVVLEQDEQTSLHLHCTCADAVFRAEAEGRFCKHIRGLLEFGFSAREFIDRLEPRARIGA